MVFKPQRSHAMHPPYSYRDKTLSNRNTCHENIVREDPPQLHGGANAMGTLCVVPR